MSGQSQVANMDQFDAYFQRADLDKDGRISGAEAIAFFQGANLSKQVLAQIWMHADKGHAGYLGRAEFYDALKLVTVAQSKRELTPEIVKAALYGPAAMKIPAPKINISSTPSAQISTLASSTVSPVSVVASTSSQNFTFGVQVPNAVSNPQLVSSMHSQTMRPPRPSTIRNISHFQLGATSEFSGPGNRTISGSQNPDMRPGLLGARAGTTPLDVMSPNRGLNQPPSITASEPMSLAHQLPIQVSKPLYQSGNSVMSTLAIGGSVSAVKSNYPVQSSSFGASWNSSGSVDSFKSVLTPQTSSDQHPPSNVPSNAKQQVSAFNPSALTAPRASMSVAYSASSQSHATWPRFEASNIQKYTKVFLEVDIDRDGKITGDQSRNLFFSWRLPREVLKQVWDLSDQDNDSMLSLKEFCIALYLLERYREGRALPPVLPNNILFDETLLAMTHQSGTSHASHANANVGASYGLGMQQSLRVSQPMGPATGLRPPNTAFSLQGDSVMQVYTKNPGALQVENPGRNQENFQHATFHDTTDSPKQADGMGSLVLDSKEKMELYRTKMQELVLYKSRCDNRLNEITERASADKQEAESLAKKYEEKYKQVAEIATKLTVEEARFRDTQERKMELLQAISKMEQGGSADGILQVRVDRIQSDMEKLTKALNVCCEKHGLDVKSTDIIELPPGWQSGVEEHTAEWDEEWDKFEDEGFSSTETNSIGIIKPASLATQESSLWKGVATSEDSPISNSTSNIDDIPEKLKASVDSPSHMEAIDAQSEFDFVRSSPGSPAVKFDDASPRKLFDVRFTKSNEFDSEIHRSFDQPGWGSFDNNDDVDSVWGFNPVSSKEMGAEQSKENYFFESPSAESGFRKSIFAESLPGTPRSKFANSPRYSEVSGDHFFDNISRFDSFATRDSGVPSSLARFDSIRSSRDFGTGNGFLSFEEADPFGSSGPFRVSSQSHSPRKNIAN